MTTRDDFARVPLGARLFPGVDLTLWSGVLAVALLVVAATAVTVWALVG